MKSLHIALLLGFLALVSIALLWFNSGSSERTDLALLVPTLSEVTPESRSPSALVATEAELSLEADETVPLSAPRVRERIEPQRSAIEEEPEVPRILSTSFLPEGASEPYVLHFDLGDFELGDQHLKNAVQLFQLRLHESPPDGPFSSEHANGKSKESGQYLHGRKVGLWTTWHENGNPSSEGRYVHGTKHGLWTSWHSNGERSSTGDYLYDRMEGAWLTYRDDGSKEELANYVNGNRDGALERWHANGTHRESSNFVFGEVDGAWRGWHENGQLKAHGQFERGKRVGHWEFRDSEGNLDEEQTGRYENGERVEE